MTAPSQFLPHLAATLREAREADELTLRDMEEFGRDRTSYWRFEQLGDSKRVDDKYWPNLDEYVTAYALALNRQPAELWAAAITRYADALVESVALTARPGEAPKDAGRRVARVAGEKARAPKQSPPQARPKSRGA